MFCPELQKLLKPIYDLTRKGRPLVLGKEQQDSFEEIKHRFIKPPVLHMPNTTGKISFIFRYKQICNRKCSVSNTKWQTKLIAYASKRLPEAAKNYSITELELR